MDMASHVNVMTKSVHAMLSAEKALSDFENRAKTHRLSMSVFMVVRESRERESIRVVLEIRVRKEGR